MNIAGWNREWTEIIIITAVSVLLYQLNMLILFLIPLEILFVRKGNRPLLYAGIGVLAVIGIISLIRVSALQDGNIKSTLIAIEILLPLVFIGGLLALELPWKQNLRKIHKLMITTVSFGAVSIPVFLLLSRSGELSQLLEEQINTISGIFQTSEQLPETNNAIISILQNPEEVTELIKDILLKNFVFIYYIILSGCVWIGGSAGMRTIGVRPRKLTEYVLPEWFIWPLLISWAIVLLDVLLGIGALSYVGWNAGLVMLFTFGMQGIGIMQSILNRRGVPRGLRIVLAAAIVLFLLWPGVNMVIIVGLPCLGVSEVWIKYRKPQKEQR